MTMGLWKGKARDDGYGDGASGGIVLPLDMSITAVRQYVWRQGSELMMHYRRNKHTMYRQNSRA